MMVKYFNIVALFIVSSCFAQIKLEVTVRNLSDLPLDVIPDTKGFAFPIIDNLQKDYIGNNVLRHVDEMANPVTYSTFER